MNKSIIKIPNYQESNIFQLITLYRNGTQVPNEFTVTIIKLIKRVYIISQLQIIRDNIKQEGWKESLIRDYCKFLSDIYNPHHPADVIGLLERYVKHEHLKKYVQIKEDKISFLHHELNWNDSKKKYITNKRRYEFRIEYAIISEKVLSLLQYAKIPRYHYIFLQKQFNRGVKDYENYDEYLNAQVEYLLKTTNEDNLKIKYEDSWRQKSDFYKKIRSRK